MTYPTIFNNLPGSPSTNPASLIDTMFNIVGAMGAIPCTASGTNAITVTPNTNYYQPAAYANYQIVSFVAVANATGVVTIRLGALAFVKLFMPSGVQANSGDINLNGFYIAAFNGALDSGNGGFQVFNASTPSVVQGVVGAFKNLKVTNGGSPDTQVAVTADQVMLGTSGGGTARVTTVSLSISTATSGANGLDAGSVAQATWYAIYVIFNGSTTAGLLSTSFSSPTLPSGYTYFARVGAIQTGAASTNLTRTIQYGRRVQYVVTTSTQTPNLPQLVTGVEGSVSVPTWFAVALAAFVPPTASSIRGVLFLAASSGGTVMMAPNNSYGIFSDATNSPPIVLSQASSLAYRVNMQFDFELESTNIYYASNTTASTALILGFDDNL